MNVQEALEHLDNADGSGINHGDIYGPGDEVACWRVLATEYRQRARHEVNDLAMLVRRLCYQLRKNKNPVAQQAMDYLRRHGLEGSILR